MKKFICTMALIVVFTRNDNGFGSRAGKSSTGKSPTIGTIFCSSFFKADHRGLVTSANRKERCCSICLFIQTIERGVLFCIGGTGLGHWRIRVVDYQYEVTKERKINEHSHNFELEFVVTILGKKQRWKR